MQTAENLPVQQLKDWLAKEREGLLAANVATIVAAYSGSSDEGMYEGAVVLDERGLAVKYEVPAEIEALLERAVDTLAPAGYEINEGGGGEIRLFSSSGTISHRSYFVTIEYNSEDAY